MGTTDQAGIRLAVQLDHAQSSSQFALGEDCNVYCDGMPDTIHSLQLLVLLLGQSCLTGNGVICPSSKPTLGLELLEHG